MGRGNIEIPSRVSSAFLSEPQHWEQSGGARGESLKWKREKSDRSNANFLFSFCVLISLPPHFPFSLHIVSEPVCTRVSMNIFN